MAIISEWEEEEHTPPPSSSTGSHDADEEVLLQILNRKGPVPFFETVVDLLCRRSDLFKRETSVSKLMEVLSAAKEKEVVGQTAANKKADKEQLSENLTSKAKAEIKEEAVQKMDVDETKENQKMDVAETKENSSSKLEQVNGGDSKEAETVMSM